MSMELKEIALKWALKNAVDHDGKAMVGPVIAKVIGEHPELREMLGGLRRSWRGGLRR